MNRTRYSLLGLGHPRSRWFTDVAQWSTAGLVPVDFAKCVSAGEIRLRIGGLQRYSAVLIESTTSGLDRDLLDAARAAGAAAIIVETTSNDEVDWLELGASAIIHAPLTPSVLTEVLGAHATSIAPNDVINTEWSSSSEPEGSLVAVCGAGGTGVSTVAIALAQGLASDPLAMDLVALCDLARNGEQAMLHDVTDQSVGIEDLVDAFRTRRSSNDEVRALTLAMQSRGYRLLLGQRRTGAWSAMPPRAVSASLGGLRRAFRFVVADITGDFEGEQTGGSIDVEERNCLSRTAALDADVVVVVGTPGIKGVHSLGRTIRELLAMGIDGTRLVPAINHAPRRGLERVAITRALNSLTADVATNVPIFLPHVDVDSALHDGTRLPLKQVGPITSAVLAVIEQGKAESIREDHFAVVPGTFGLFDRASGQ